MRWMIWVVCGGCAAGFGHRGVQPAAGVAVGVAYAGFDDERAAGASYEAHGDVTAGDGRGAIGLSAGYLRQHVGDRGAYDGPTTSVIASYTWAPVTLYAAGGALLGKIQRVAVVTGRRAGEERAFGGRGQLGVGAELVRGRSWTLGVRGDAGVERTQKIRVSNGEVLVSAALNGTCATGQLVLRFWR